jgi:hypothetical protein
VRPSGYLPRGLPPSTADLATLAGIAAERVDLKRLHQAGRIDEAALRTGKYVLDLMEHTRRLAERYPQRR